MTDVCAALITVLMDTQVWDTQGALMHRFDGHSGPACCVCPHSRGAVSFVFSTAKDGRIKVLAVSLSDPRAHATHSLSSPRIFNQE
jgi:WD40 repeat protein